MANTLKFGNGEWYGKKDTILAYNDENSNYKPLPFDFSRASKATVINKDGLIETVGSGEPRIDYKDDSKGALLLEPQRTNLIEYSEDFSQSSWGKTNVTLTSNNVISPDGTQNASKIVATGSDSSLQDSITVTSGTTYTFSVYLKTVSGTLDTAIGLGSPGFPQNEGEGGRYKNITVTNEWKRYTLTSTADASAASGIGVGGFNSFSTGEEVYVWGAMLEQSAFATSYIPTQGSAVTRLEDECNNGANEQVINSTEGVLYAEIKPLVNDASLRSISISDGSTSNEIFLQFSNATSRIECRIIVGGVLQSRLLYTFPSSDEFLTMSKFALKYKTDDFSLWINGTEKDADSSGSVPPGNVLDLLKFERSTAGQKFHGNIKDVRVYNTALTDAELIALTS